MTIRTLMFLLLTFAFSLSTNASEESRSINQTMTDIGSVMGKTFPTIVAKKKLEPMEEKVLHDAVKQLSQLFTQIKPQILQRSDTYQISYDLVLDYLENINRKFKRKDVESARRALYSLGAICASCHTQDTQSRTIFPGVGRQSFDSDLSYADFNYMTRDYNRAVKYYDKHLRSNTQKTELELVQTMQRLITVYTQIYNTPGVAAKQLSEYKALNDHTEKTKEHLNGWIDGLKKLKSSGVLDTDKTSFEKLKKYVKKYIGNTDQAAAEIFSTAEDEVARVWLRGQLFHYLNSNPPKEEIPIILYWLSICDRSVGYSYNFSLADLYLKQCIKSHSKHPYAKKCYTEYQAFIEIMYSGSGGMFIPPELEDELIELRSIIEP